ncbi:tRNA-dependent cyclodipeptide synthase [Nocardia iowensis]|uniref:tRNA-dependent cyclodipeptide synthase n=1 Tax=Nocardia iowensis TaxID=204891 RepID=A0ABX8RWM4_NOCIO|nr:tRNA-dependent cyclodipeptide synthase [Nocardia iowensis]QXN94053.1 tRNA-dependent cyclodipeptide synthase [Nocardia iowensis]
MTTTTLLSASHKAAYDLRSDTITTEGRSTVLLVSVGADYHEGEKLAATIDLINRSNFGRCAIAVADTLQRHNLSGGTDIDRHARARIAGDEWITRNIGYLNQIDCPTNILRWDFALSHPRYGDLYDAVEQAYETDDRYRNAVDSTIDRFIERRLTREPDVDQDMVRKSCRAYLLEECPIIMPLWAHEGFDYVIYPQRISAAMGRTRELFVEPEHPDRVAWLPLRFKKRKSALHNAEGAEQ